MNKIYVKMMRYNIFCTILLFFTLYHSSSFGQEVKGRIVDTAGVAIPDVNILIISATDSVFLNGGISDENGKFNITTQVTPPFILQASCLGYKQYSTTIVNIPINLIVLYPNEYELNQLIIKGEKSKIVEKQAGKIIMNVSSTYLMNEPNITSLLSKIPGVKVSESTINIFGKKNIKVYIDKREASIDQVKSLNPSNILKIEKINYPGAQYEANTDGIIHIYTNRNRFTNTMEITLKDEVAINRGVNNNTSIGINFSRNIVSQSFDYKHTYTNGNMQHDTYEAYNYLKSQTNLRKSDDCRYPKKIRHNIFYGISVQATSKLVLGAQYTGNIRNDKVNREGTLDIFSNELPLFKEKVFGDKKSDWQMHNIGINLLYKFNKKLNFTLLGDYSYADSHIDEKIIEQNSQYEKRNTTISDDIYHIISVIPTITYSTDKLNLEAGVKISSLADYSNIQYKTYVNKEKKSEIRDFIGAAYIQTSIKTKFVDIKFGLRGEYTNSEREENDKRDRSIYNNLFPYLSLEKSINDNLDIMFNYRNSIDRPSIAKLSPTYIYVDTLYYMKGNPFLKPERAHMFALNVNYNSLSFDIDYSIYKNSCYLRNNQDTENPNIVVCTYDNLEYNNKILTMGLSYNYDSKYLSAMGSVMVEIPKSSIYYRDSLITYNKPLWYLQLSANYKISKTFSFSASFEYNSCGDDMCTSYKSYWVLNSGINCMLLKKSLLLSVNVYDIFQSRSTSLSFQSENLYGIRYTVTDSRQLALSLRYIFGGKAKPVKKISSNNDVRGRL